MDRRTYSALPLIIVDGNSGTVQPVALNNLPRHGRFRRSWKGKSAPGSRARYLHTRARRPPARHPLTIDRTSAKRDGFNPAPFNYLEQTPNKRASLWLLGSRPLGETANLFLEGFADRTGNPRSRPRRGFLLDGALVCADGPLPGSFRPTTITTPSGSTFTPSSLPGRGRQPEDRTRG